METSLEIGSDIKPVHLRFRERLHSEANNITLTVDGMLDTSSAKLQARGTAFKHFVMPGSGGLDNLLDRVDIGVSYATDTDDIYASIRAKKAYNFGNGNMSGTLSAIGEADANMDRKVFGRGRVEMASKVFSFNNNQDVKLKVGYGHKRIGVSSKFIEGPYGCIKENNWSLLTDFQKYWTVRYTL